MDRRPEDWSRLVEPQNAGLFRDALDVSDVTTGSYPDLERALRGLLSSGGGTRAVAIAGEERVRAALTEALPPFCHGDGAFVMHNHFRLLVANRAA